MKINLKSDQDASKYNIIQNGITKSINDICEYNIKILQNGLKIFHVYDPISNYSAAAMDVNIGYDADPDEYMGLAHFVEHLLFMGSKKYKDEALFQTEIAKYNGLSNAYTSSTNTVYYFNVPNFSFEHILDIFCNFFVEPLFNVNSVEKEVNSINSEHEKNIDQDNWRMHHISHKFFNKDNPGKKFSTGNNDTLLYDGIYKLQKACCDFFNKYYSSNRMILYIYNNKKNINDIYCNFGKIKSQVKLSIIKYPNKIFDDNSKKMIRIQSNSNSNIIEYIWELPITQHFNEVLVIILFILNSKDNNSIYKILAKNDLILDINCALEKRYGDNIIFGIKMILTDKGIQQQKYILNYILKYIEYLLTIPFSEYEYIYDVIMINERILYIESNKTNPSSTILNFIDSVAKYNVNLNKLLSFKTIKQTIEYKDIIEILSKITFNNCYCILSNNKELEDAEYDKYYKMKYKFEKLDKDNGEHEFKFLSKNKYQIDEIIIKNSYTEMCDPINVKNNWFLDKYNDKGNITSSLFVTIQFPNLFEKNDYVIRYLTNKIYVMGLNIKHSHFFEQCDNSGYNVYLGTNNDGINIMINGPSQNINIIIDDLLFILFECKKNKFDKVTFNKSVDNMREMLNNFKSKKTFEKLNEIFEKMIGKYSITVAEMEKYINELNTKKINSMMRRLFKKCKIYGLIGGESIDTNIINKMETNMKLYKKQIKRKYNNNINKNINIKQENTSNSAISYNIYFGKMSIENTPNWDKNLCCIFLFDNISKSIYYDEMRTKQQLGYIVTTNYSSYGTDTKLYNYLSFIIQSPVAKCDTLIKKTKECINKIREYINKMEEIEFVQMKLSIRDKLLEKFNDNISRLQYNFKIMINGDTKPLFNRKILLANTMNDLSLNYMKQYIDIIFKKNRYNIIGID